MHGIKKFLLLFLLIAILAVPVSASYTKTVDAADLVVVNQSSVQDPTNGSVPWTLYVASGFIALTLIVLALIRPKSQRMDYEVNIILSVLAWPFVWYWTWGGLTSIDYIVGIAGTTTYDAKYAGNVATYVTQHILYSFWVLGWIGVAGCIFAAFVTALLVAQYNLFKDNEATETARQQQKGIMKEES